MGGPPMGGPPGGPPMGGPPGEGGPPAANKVQKVKSTDVFQALKKSLKSYKGGQEEGQKV